ncbi:MAG: hypothetical protein AB7E26_13530 [Chryseobacterium sp.]
MKPKNIQGIPHQKSGGFHDTESIRQYNINEIDAKFSILKERLLSINKWKKYCGKTSSEFRHFSKSGEPIDRIPQMGDLIRIGIPGPGSKEANGYDWVKITNIMHRKRDQYESYLILCRPTKVPGQHARHIAHFYSHSATSAFMIEKDGNMLKAGIYGRNEKPNFNATFIDKIRNLIIALGGIFGFSKIQWKVLTEGLLDFK